MTNTDPLCDDSGAIVGVINCFQEVTDRKLAAKRR
jgi:hypothetical protein